MNNKSFWQLPYESRRKAFSEDHPDDFQRLQALKTVEPEQLSLPTFKPFLDKKCIFLHIPKTAGISLGYSLFGRHTGNHTTLQEYQIAFSEEEYNDLYKFAFVRNPWDRLLSAYMFLKAGGRNPGDAAWAQRHLGDYTGFDTFVKHWVSEENIQKGMHFKPQSQFITVPNNDEVGVDFLGKFENLEADFKRLREELQFGDDLIFKNKTASKVKKYQSYYTQESKEVVAKVYQRDIELLGYSF